MSGGLPFTEIEINSAVESLVALEPEFSQRIDDYTNLLKECAHLSHKNWKLTECFSDKLSEIIGRNVDSKMFQTLFHDICLNCQNNSSSLPFWLIASSCFA